ncbi:MAG: hypothetical protein LBC75_06945 [Fibromonadaceae bacterium]|jgi:hypothetical protein|nr:hypothetical protein [Fibromonadaceae bacterium]
MKYLFLIFCLILCSCEQPVTCIPIVLGFTFDSQEGIDSMITYNNFGGYDYLGNFIGVRNEEGCEVKPDTIKCSWFSLVKKDSIVFASVKQNDTGRKRYEVVNIKRDDGTGECDGRSGNFTISQCPEPAEQLLFGSEGALDSLILTINGSSWSSITIDTGWNYLEDPWFAIIDIVDKEKNKMKIIFSISKNESGKERNAILTVDSNNCGSSVKIIQAAE